MSADYWGYDNTLGVEFDDRTFHENVKTFIEKVTADGSLFFIDAKNSTQDEIFYAVVTERYPLTITDSGSITSESFEGEESLLEPDELYDEWGDGYGGVEHDGDDD